MTTDRTEPKTASSAQRPIRWWPGLLIAVAAVGRVAWTWLDARLARQEQVMRTGGVILVAVGLLLVWVLFFSRMRWPVRWRVLGGFLGVLALGALLFRYVGVTGDLVPIFEPRWATGARTASLPAGTSSNAVRVDPGIAPTVPGAAPTEGRGGGDFPQFLGPTRDGVMHGIRLETDLAAHPPQLLWRLPMGSGWGGFAVVGGLALTQEQDGGDELVTAYDLATGGRVWAHRTAALYDNPIGGIGPRATPTVVSNRVYALGAVGDLSCLDLATGALRWTTNLVGGKPAKDLSWGLSSSPLVLGDRVIVAPLGRPERASLLALDAATGTVVWSGGTAEAHFSSPRLETLRGMPQLLTFTGAGAAGHDPATGALLWEHPWRGGHPHVTDPRVVDAERGRVLVTSGYGTGSQLIEVERVGAEGWRASTNLVWRSMRLKSKFANVLLRDGFVYGLDDGRLVCLDLGTGERRWDGDRFGHGQLLLVGDLLLLTAESGEVILVDAAPVAFRERARFAAVTGKTWNPPALAGDVLIVRNDREAAAFRMAVQR
jgi:outer membrane protein assembly factor BamB